MPECKKHNLDYILYCPECEHGEALAESDCSHCDGAGGKVTFENQASLPLNGKVQCIDWCIHQIVAALNAGGVETVASCCGHGEKRGRIDLADGRTLYIENTEPTRSPESGSADCSRKIK
jgi:hypothetical protein